MGRLPAEMATAAEGPAIRQSRTPSTRRKVRQLALQEGSVLVQTPAQVQVWVRELAPGRVRGRVMVRVRVALSLGCPPAPPRAP